MTIQDKCFGKYEIEWTDCYTVIENGIAIDATTKEKSQKRQVRVTTLQGQAQLIKYAIF